MLGQTNICQKNRKQSARNKQIYLPSYSIDKAGFSDSRIACDANIYFNIFPSIKFPFEELFHSWNAMFFYVPLNIFHKYVFPRVAIHIYTNTVFFQLVTIS